jgi:hypothetical protein
VKANPDEDLSEAGYVDYTGMPSREELLERYARGSASPSTRWTTT